VGRRKSLEAKNKQREEPVSPSMPLPDVPTSEETLPATEIEELKQVFKLIDDYPIQLHHFYLLHINIS
jgi:hypothetical protein